MDINLVYAADDAFAEYLGISLTSLLENCRHADEAAVYILDCGISAVNSARLVAVCEKYGSKISFIDSSQLLDPEMKQERGSLSTFARLFMAELLPVSVDKALYLDCDVLVLGAAEELYDTDIGGYFCAGVRDCISMARLRLDGLSENDTYINAGVMLVDLDMWRREKASAAFEEFSQKHGGNVQYADQGIINGVFKGRILPLDLRYNCYTAVFDFSYSELMTFRKPPVYYSEAETKAAKSSPFIVHFTTSFLSLRPWFEGCKHPYSEQWIKYRRMTPWADEPMKKCRRRSNGMARMVFRLLPRKAAVFTAGFVHSIAIPALKGGYKK